VIDYLRERFEDKLSGYDCAFDLIGGNARASVAGPQTSRTRRLDRRHTGAHGAPKDLGRRGGLAALSCVASLTTRLRAARHGIRYRYLFMHPSGPLSGSADRGHEA
jgi:hypothetical protein